MSTVAPRTAHIGRHDFHADRGPGTMNGRVASSWKRDALKIAKLLVCAILAGLATGGAATLIIMSAPAYVETPQLHGVEMSTAAGNSWARCDLVNHADLARFNPVFLMAGNVALFA